MVIRNKFTAAALACVLGSSLVGTSAPVLASETGAFIGGVFATKLLGNMRDRTEAEQQQAAAATYSAQQQPVASASAPKSAQQRLDELDKLAAGGYITPQEYKAKKQKIIDSM